MEHIVEFGDERQKAWCIHCGGWLDETSRTRDHVPTRALLDKPYPAHLPTVWVCRQCNGGFSEDEQYLVALLGCVLSGTAEVDGQSDPRIARLLENNPGLRSRIASARRTGASAAGRELVAWVCEQRRMARVIVKNARGHVLFECNEPMLSERRRVWFATVGSLSGAEREAFEEVADPADRLRSGARIVLPEVGSRAMARWSTMLDTVEGWVEVQQGVYRYAVEQNDGGLTRVRSVMREYLATEVIWEG